MGFRDMRSLLVLTAVFTLLVAYFEQTATEAHASLASYQPAKVIRTVKTAAAKPSIDKPVQIAKAAPQPETRSALDLDLNLSLPSMQDTTQALETKATSLLNLFKEQGSKQKVTYNAELVFDRETGEEITGGKVNIKIPLS